MKKTTIIIAMILGIFSLTACGKEEKDDIASDLETIGMETEPDSESESGSIPESLDYTVDGSGVMVKAKVYADGIEDAKVYNVTRKEIDEEFLKQLADGLFEGEYSYVKPYMHCSLEELELEKQVYDNIYNESIGEDGEHHVSDTFSTYYSKLEEITADYSASGAFYIEHNGLLYHQDEWRSDIDSFDGWTADKIAAADYSRIRGERGNHTYELYYEKYYLDYDISADWCRYSPSNIKIRCLDSPYTLKAREKNMDKSGNQLDYETAVKQAEDIMEDMGFKDSEIIGANQLWVSASEEQMVADLNGYAIWFSVGSVDNNLIQYGDCLVIALGTDNDLEYVNAAGLPYVMITVTDAGLIDINIGDIYSEPTVSAEDVLMLSFDQINEIAKEKLKEMKPETMTFPIDEIILQYAYVTYDGINYSIVPVWAYYATRELWFPDAVLYLNALDGNEIGFGMEKDIRGYFPVIYEEPYESGGIRK
ncbi:MAG: hypothetical protein K2G45_08865 [Lachnospiraceae bacterium]|nr:hypothetical protein [Lachnospiraceae bacterium]